MNIINCKTYLEHHMKILKISENQIRCILTSEDLKERNLKLSELAYGSQKARDLFSEMMTKANKELGFNAQDDPLMVEAIPVSKDELVLVVTKVSDPEMLDTRFARFSNDGNDSTSSLSNQLSSLNSSDIAMSAKDILESYGKLLASRKAGNGSSPSAGSSVPAEAVSEAGKENETAQQSDQKNFLFRTLEDLIQISHIIQPTFHGESSVFHVREPEVFILSLKAGTDEDPENFQRICNTVSEFGSLLAPTAANLNALKEHNQVLLSKDAVSKLAQL